LVESFEVIFRDSAESINFFKKAWLNITSFSILFLAASFPTSFREIETSKKGCEHSLVDQLYPKSLQDRSDLNTVLLPLCLAASCPISPRDVAASSTLSVISLSLTKNRNQRIRQK
jgi:hypothetical protein